MTGWLHPGILLILGSLFVPLFKGRAKGVFLVALPSAALLDCILMAPGTYGVINFLGYDLTFGRVDRLSLLFSYIFSIMGIIGIVYALHVKDDLQHIASLVYVGGSLGVTFAGDFFVLFIFWEAMALSAAFLVWLRRSKEAVAAGFRYLLVHLFSGVCLFGGSIIHIVQTGSIAFNSMMPYEGGIAFYLILLSFIINAAVPPFGAWLPDAYPEATVTGAVFMTAFTTKSAVYVLIRGFPGTEILIWMGAIMAVYGVVYAVLENDGRRLLAYHIISQVGYMVCGVGIGTEMALNGSASHAFAHILYKGLLFMGAGAVLEMTGRRKLTELGGIYKTMPITMVLYMIGGFSISAVPLFSGFVSKSMVVSAAGESHLPFAFLMLTLASSGTFLHTGLKLPYYMFFAKDSGMRTKEPPKNMLIAMGIAAFLCIIIGVFPQTLYSLLPFHVDYAPYTAQHVLSTLGILGFTSLGFFMFLRHLDPEPTISMDTDWFYRKGSRVFMWVANKPIAIYEEYLGEIYNKWFTNFTLRFSNFLWRIFDIKIIDGLVNDTADFFMELGQLLRRYQTGLVRNYAFSMLFGGLVIIGYYLLK
jgi:multicomponent Na+:H+ antiporter subunit D